MRLVVIALGLVVGGFVGAAASGRWQTFLTWRNGTPFGATDPQFGLDISFYVFDYPWWRFVLGLAFTRRDPFAARGARHALPVRRAAAPAAAGRAVDAGDPAAPVDAARRPAAAEGGRLLVRPLRPHAVAARAVHRRVVHRHHRGAPRQDDHDDHRADLRGPAVRQRVPAQLAAARRRRRAAAALDDPDRRRLPGDHPAVPGEPERGRARVERTSSATSTPRARRTASPSSTRPTTTPSRRPSRASSARTPTPCRASGCSTRTS